MLGLEHLITAASSTASLTDYLFTRENRYKSFATGYMIFYYFSRTVTCLCAAVLPFIVGEAGMIKYAKMSSILIAVMVALDFVFNPKENWKKYSKSYNDLVIRRLNKKG